MSKTKATSAVNAAAPIPDPLAGVNTRELLRDVEQLGGTIEALRYVLEKAANEEDGWESIDWNALAGLCRAAFTPYDNSYMTAKKLVSLQAGAR